MFAVKRKKKSYSEDLIMGNHRISLDDLRKKTKRANRRFWGIAVSMGMVGTLVLPYMSLAAVAPKNTNVFTGQVIPGYSMGGIQLAAYGVDVNSWGQVSRDTPIRSNYGVWSGDRGIQAEKNLASKDSETDLETNAENENMLSTHARAVGWKDITGKMNYSTSNLDGTNSSNASSQYDTVAPYRTPSDVQFWNKDVPTSNGNASASITVSLLPDFVILNVDEKGQLHLLESPDQVNSNGISALYQGDKEDTDADKVVHGNNKSYNSAIPYYIPLSVIFKEFNITDPKEANITNLINKIKNDNDGTLGKLAVKQENNLLNGTSYSNFNTGSSETSEAFNPYPYSMVFEKETNNGTVVSSLYENSEAYVYFSPASVYTQYMAVRTEYEKLRDEIKSKKDSIADSVTAFQLGYYLAAMSILEAYLEEALPQDMTRGYVGPSENASVMGDLSAIPGQGTTAIKSASNPEDLQSSSYISLTYDFSVNQKSEGKNEWRQHETDAIMDTLSVFGYFKKGGFDEKRTGVMKGLKALDNQRRCNIFGAIQRDTESSGEMNTENDKSGMYTPTYYPVQQHVMPESEKVYRFQILSAVPYDTLLDYIYQYGFRTGVTFIYSTENSKSIASFENIVQAQNREAELAAMYENAENNGDSELILSNVDIKSLSVFKAQGTNSTETDESMAATASRIDAALQAYDASAMNSDNVHDLLDVVRATVNLRIETWLRYYNPIKSSGGDNDLFLARISPAKTTYFPDLLVKGYTAAGGEEVESKVNPQHASFDYFALPSFAPCFASHTGDSTHYGILNYELRPFYSRGFVSTLSENANIPAVGDWQDKEEAAEKAEQKMKEEGVSIDKNLAALYIMAKRCSYLKAAKEIVTTHNVEKKWLKDFAWRLKNFTPANDDNSKKINLAITGKIDNGNIPDSIDLNQCFYVYKDSLQTDLTQNSNVIKTLSTMATNATGTRGKVMSAVPESKDNWGEITDWQDTCPFDEGLQNNFFVVRYDNDGNPFSPEQTYDGKYDPKQNKDSLKLQGHWIFNAWYNKYFESYLGDSGSHWWCPWDAIRTRLDSGVKPDVPDGTEYNEDEREHYTVYLRGSWVNELAKELGITIEKNDIEHVLQVYEEQMSRCSQELAQAFLNITEDIQLITEAMPTRMQNCLAWADYQNPSDSEAQYQPDPTEETIVDNSADTTVQKKIALSDIQNLSTAQKYGFNIDVDKETGEFKAYAEDTNAEEGDRKIEARIERGVEGSTWTSTTQPAIYTMSATIARINNMSTQVGTVYPYSGLANGRLQSGTDQYALLQAHVIDYSAIASGIAGDTATRQRAQVVSLVDPQFASITDFTDIAGIIGAFFGEMGASVIRGAAEIFSETMFSDNSTGLATSSDPMGNGAPTTMSYMLPDGTTMNRTPAMLATFNPNTGKLEYGQTYNDTSSTYIISNSLPSASAAGGNSTITNMAGSILTVWSVPYKVVQTFALTLVLVFLGFIAFRNFYAYASTAGDDGAKVLLAQTQLKKILPRSIIAVIMIGFPPLAGGTGFEGLNFVILEVIGNIATFVSGIFIGTNGSAIMDVFTNIDLANSFGMNLFAWAFYFVACLIIGLCFIIGTVMVIILHLIQLLFFFMGPIVWALFIWPYNSDTQGSMTKGLTGKLNLGFISGGAVGNLAPSGHLKQFALFSAISVGWALLFWFVAQIFVIGAGINYYDPNTAPAAELMASASGYSTASMAISSATSGVDLFGLPTGVGSFTRILFTTLVCVLVFLLMGFLLMKALVTQIQETKGLGSDIISGIKKGASATGTAMNAVGFRPQDIMKNVVTRGEDGKLKVSRPKLGDAFAEDAGIRKSLEKRRRMRDAQKFLQKKNGDWGAVGAIPEEIQKTLDEFGIDTGKALHGLPEERTAALADAKKKLGKKARMAEARKDRKEAARKKASDIAHMLGTDENGNYSGMKAMAGAAKLAGTLGRAAFNKDAKGVHGLMEGIAQTAATMNKVNVDKEIDGLSAKAKELETAKAVTDKIAAGEVITADDLKALDDKTFGRLKKEGLIKEKLDENGKKIRSLTSGAQEKAQIMSSEYSTQINDYNNKIKEKQKSQADVASKLKELGLSKDQALKDGLKVISDGFDNQRALALIEEHKFTDKDGMTAMQQARKYMSDEKFRNEVDAHESAVNSATRMLGLSDMVASGKMTEDEARRRAESFVNARPAMQALSLAANETDLSKKNKAIEDCINQVSESLPPNLSATDRMNFIESAVGVLPPALTERASLAEAVMSGTATQYQMQKYAAMMIDSKANNEVLTFATPTEKLEMSSMYVSTAMQDLPAAAQVLPKTTAVRDDSGSVIKMEIPKSAAAMTDMQDFHNALGNYIQEINSVAATPCLSAEMSKLLATQLTSQVIAAGQNANAHSVVENIAALNRPENMEQLKQLVANASVSDQNKEFVEAKKILSEDLPQVQEVIAEIQDQIKDLNEQQPSAVIEKQINHLREEMAQKQDELSVLKKATFGATDIPSLTAAFENQAMDDVVAAIAMSGMQGYTKAASQETAIKGAILGSAAMGSVVAKELQSALKEQPELLIALGDHLTSDLSPNDIKELVDMVPDEKKDLFIRTVAVIEDSVVKNPELASICPELTLFSEEEKQAFYGRTNAAMKESTQDCAVAFKQENVLVAIDNPELATAVAAFASTSKEFSDLTVDSEFIHTSELLAQGRYTPESLDAITVGRTFAIDDTRTQYAVAGILRDLPVDDITELIEAAQQDSNDCTEMLTAEDLPLSDSTRELINDLNAGSVVAATLAAPVFAKSGIDRVMSQFKEQSHRAAGINEFNELEKACGRGDMAYGNAVLCRQRTLNDINYANSKKEAPKSIGAQTPRDLTKPTGGSRIVSSSRQQEAIPAKTLGSTADFQSTRSNSMQGQNRNSRSAGTMGDPANNRSGAMGSTSPRVPNRNGGMPPRRNPGQGRR